MGDCIYRWFILVFVHILIKDNLYSKHFTDVFTDGFTDVFTDGFTPLSSLIKGNVLGSLIRRAV